MLKAPSRIRPIQDAVRHQGARRLARDAVVVVAVGILLQNQPACAGRGTLSMWYILAGRIRSARRAWIGICAYVTGSTSEYERTARRRAARLRRAGARAALG